VTALMRRFEHALDPDGADEKALRRQERRGLTLVSLPDGTTLLRGLADEVTGSLISTAVDAAAPVVKGDRRTAAQRRFDGLADICRKYLASPDAPMRGGGHAHVIVTVDEATLGGRQCSGQMEGPWLGNGGNDGDGGSRAGGNWAGNWAGQADPDVTRSPGGTLSWVGQIAGTTAQRVSCDADVTVVAVDEHGAARVVRREPRFFPWPQRKAMIARDGDRCVIPFCDRPVAWADGHHIVPVELGGPTTVDNGALPCAAHHGLLHEGHWTLRRLPDGRYQVIRPDGRTIGPEPHPPGHNRPPPFHHRE
jgi:hypothetical protein